MVSEVDFCWPLVTMKLQKQLEVAVVVAVALMVVLVAGCWVDRGPGRLHVVRIPSSCADKCKWTRPLVAALLLLRPPARSVYIHTRPFCFWLLRSDFLDIVDVLGLVC